MSDTSGVDTKQVAKKHVEHNSQGSPEQTEERDEFISTPDDELNLDEISQSQKYLSSNLTVIGEVIGTPPYMAPEQFLNLEVGDYTDQFSFCVALFEAFYGVRPFSGNRLDLLRENIDSEKILPPPEDKDVPEWLHDVIMKGLNPRPEDRFASMADLLEVLENDPDKLRTQRRAKRRRQGLVVLLVLLAVFGPLAYWYFQRVRPVENCKDVTEKLQGVWNKGVKKRLEQSFAGTGLPYASDTALRVSQNLDRYMKNWTRLRSGVCESRWSKGTESDLSFHQKMNCFELRFREFGSLVKKFLAANSELIPRAVQASLSLSSLGICSDEMALRHSIPLPEDQDTRVKVQAVRMQVAELKTLLATGKLAEGEKLARKLKKNADELSYGPLQAETSFILGDFLSRVRKVTQAERELYESASIAAESTYIQSVMRSMVMLVFVVGYQAGRSKDGLMIARDAQLLINLAGGDRKELASLFSKQGLILSELGRYGDARKKLEQAITIDEETFGTQHPSLARDLGNLGLLLMNLGEFELSRDYLKRTLAIYEKSLGSKHPYVGYTYGNLGLVEHGLEHFDQSEAYQKKALNLLEELYGTNHRDVAWCLTNLARLYLDEKNLDQAKLNVEKSIEIMKNIPAANKSDDAENFHILGAIELVTGNYKKAERDLQKSLVVTKELYGPEHVYVASILEDLGRLFLKTADYSRALRVLNRALSIRKKIKGQAKRELTVSMYRLGDVYAARNEYSKAEEQFENVLGICANIQCRPGDLHGSEFGLAKVLKSRGEKVRASKLAKKALEGFRKNPKRFAAELIQVQQWMKISR